MDAIPKAQPDEGAAGATVTLCPKCGARGRPVPATTVRHLVVGPAFADAEGWSFCATRSCDTAYYDASGQVVLSAAVSVPIFQKRDDSSRPVCYCFDHTVADVRAASRTDGGNDIVESITQACREGRDRCEEANPQGRCCLGNVRSLLREPPSRPCSSCTCEE